MEKLGNTTPGEILLEEFLIPMGISQYRLSKDLDIPQTRVAEIIKGNRRITADTAVRLSAYFGNSAKFWLGLQDDYDIEHEMNEKSSEVKRIITIRKKQRKVFIDSVTMVTSACRTTPSLDIGQTHSQ